MYSSVQALLPALMSPRWMASWKLGSTLMALRKPWKAASCCEVYGMSPMTPIVNGCAASGLSSLAGAALAPTAATTTAAAMRLCQSLLVPVLCMMLPPPEYGPLIRAADDAWGDAF